MPLIDCTLSLDDRGTVTGVHWSDPQLQKAYEQEWKAFVGQRLSVIPDFRVEAARAKITWRNEEFDYQEVVPAKGLRLLLLKKEDHRTLLFEYALNAFPDGIQIYDANACVVHINRASCGISGIPAHLDVTGKHLMDLYDLEEEISTTMTCLRTRRPVINRVDSFKSTSGNAISTVNTAYPVFDGHKLVGAVVTDQNLDTLNAQIETLEERKKTIRDKTSLPATPFRGYHFSDLVGSNRELTAAVALARKISRQDCNVLLVGETGTGKEIFAQSIHKASDRKKKKFVAINCAAVPDTLIESMFFGTSKGSFTGSVEQPGLLEEADGGVLFLDELNSMSLGMQSKLLRAIQEGSFRRVGSGRDIRTNVRFISSCNEPPAHLIEQNVLRKDLFFRLATVTIDIPPLRDREDDIEELVRFYLAKNINRYLKTVEDISPGALRMFQNYSWPGNVRELFNLLDYILNTAEDGRIEVAHLPRHMRAGEEPSLVVARPEAESSTPPLNWLEHFWRESGQSCQEPGQEPGQEQGQEPGQKQGRDLDALLRAVEKRVIEEALARCRYRLNRTADSLGVSRQTLQYRIRKLGIEL